MKTIYLDSDFMCHLQGDDKMLTVETSIFDTYYNTAIEYFRFIPTGYLWEDAKGRTIHGEFIQSTNSEKIDQKQIETALVDMTNALAILGVTE